MSNIRKLIDNYADVVKIIAKHGFKKATIFKGFIPAEEHNFNILLEDNKQIEHPRLATRKRALKEDLIKLLGYKVLPITPQGMDEYFLNELKKDNTAVVLTPDLPLAQLEKVFGLEWEFSPPDTSLPHYRPPTSKEASVAASPFHLMPPSSSKDKPQGTSADEVPSPIPRKTSDPSA